MASLTFEKFFSDHRKRLEAIHESSGATNWSVSLDELARAVWEGIDAAASVEPGNIPDLLQKIRADELALALACAKGNERAWEAFSFGYRTAIYEAACSFAPDLAVARELSDSLAAELYGVESGDGPRRSKLTYFHGRSSLRTWLRAVVYQKFVDEYRRMSRLEPLPENPEALAAETRAVSEQDEHRYVKLLSEAVSVTLRELPGAEKMLLGFYYVQQLTLKQIGRIRGEHESTVSRQLDAVRKKLRKQIENHLRKVKKLNAYEVDQCFNYVARGVMVDLDAELKKEKIPQEGTGGSF
ncbi:MAG: sigma-70 family RNA polymerase sigma factor [Acidobacteriia bacterium]|nr:sigma-70 family RNA polymerase sigma factor [Terriglobia bacterium]